MITAAGRKFSVSELVAKRWARLMDKEKIDLVG